MASMDARLAIFARVDNTARVEVVARRLADAITLGLLRDGEQLPSETDLAALLGVSTVTLREALVALRQQGLVETRRGRGGGSFVRAPDGPDETRERLRGITANELRDFGDHYTAIAGAAARLAAERCVPADLLPLRRTLEEMAEAGSAAELRRLDGRFHVEVAAVSQSARLTREEISLQAGIGLLLRLPFEDPKQQDVMVHQHTAIVEAIAEGDSGRARLMAERHIADAVEHLIELKLREL